MRDYVANPANNLCHNGATILCGLERKDTGKPAWAIPGGTFTTSKREAARVARLICKMRNKK